MAIVKNIILIPLFLLFVFCSTNDFNPVLVDYIRAEREMKKKIPQNQGLDDSLIALQKRLKIDVDKELKKVKNRPELWIKLLKAIDGEK